MNVKINPWEQTYLFAAIEIDTLTFPLNATISNNQPS
jgi:hypothetical protein